MTFLLPKSIAILLLSLCLALFAFHPMTPAVPQWGLDASWVAVMGEAANRHLRWGADLAFPYGPASSLLTGYEDSRYLTRTLPTMLAVSLGFGWGAVLLFTSGERHARAGTPAVAVGTFAIAIAGSRGFPDVPLILLPLLPFLLTVAPSGPRGVDALSSAVLAFVVGVTGMAKMSFVVLALPLFVMGDATLLIRHRFPFLVPLFLIGFACAGAALGQTFEGLPVAMLRQWDVVAGYSEAMAVDGSRPELLTFVIAAGLLLAFAARAEAKVAQLGGTPLGWGLLRVVGLALAVFMLFKAGFVRQDLHTLIAWNGLAIAALLTLWSRYRFWARGPAIIAISAALAVVLLVCPAIMISTAPPGTRVAAAAKLYDAWLLTEPAAQLRAAANALVDPPGFADALADTKNAALAKITDLFPLPPSMAVSTRSPRCRAASSRTASITSRGRASRNTRPIHGTWPRPTAVSSKGRKRLIGSSSARSRAETI